VHSRIVITTMSSIGVSTSFIQVLGSFIPDLRTRSDNRKHSHLTNRHQDHRFRPVKSIQPSQALVHLVRIPVFCCPRNLECEAICWPRGRYMEFWSRPLHPGVREAAFRRQEHGCPACQDQQRTSQIRGDGKRRYVVPFLEIRLLAEISLQSAKDSFPVCSHPTLLCGPHSPRS